MYDNLPEWLKKPPIFCVCDETKKPKFPTKPDDLSTFFPFDEAVKAIGKGERLGVGLWDALCGIDIDKCIDEAGVISDDAKTIINLFPDAYIEYSPSHTGLHILFLSKEQHKDKDLYYTKPSQKFLKSLNIKGMKGLEFYQGMADHRYFTVTGDVYQEQPDKTFISGDRIQSFLDTYMKRPVPITSSLVSVTTDDEEDMAWYKFTKFLYNNLPFRNEFPSIEKLHELLERTPTGSGGTESEDDLSLLANLAFWCNHNPRVMRYAFEHSPYYDKKDAKHKKKWARQDYSEGAITRATQNVNVAKIYFKDFFKYIPENKTMDFSGFLAHVKKGDGPMVYAVEGKDNVYTYKDDNGIRYYAHIRQSKAGKNYVKYLNAYDCNKKEKLGDIEARDSEGNCNSKFFEIANHFLKNIK